MAGSCGQLLDGRDRGLGKLVGTVPGRRCQRRHRLGGAFDLVPGTGVAIALAHDDQQAVPVDIPQLGAEKSRVYLWFSIQLRDGTQVSLGLDNRDADAESGSFGFAGENEEFLFQSQSRRMEWQEHSLVDQGVAWGVAIRECQAW